MADFYVATKKKELIEELGICGCGCPTEAYKAVHEVLFKMPSLESEEMDNPYISFMIYTLNHLGFLEHGSSIYGSWLTEKGRQLLEALDIFAQFDYDWEITMIDSPNDFWELKNNKE